jgi:WD40 repeat protein
MDWRDGVATVRAPVVHEHHRPASSVTFRPDGQLAAALFRDGSLSLIEPKTWQILQSFASPPYATAQQSVQWAQAAERIVVARNLDIEVWPAPPGVVVPTLHLHLQAVNSVDLHPDGRTVLTASADGSVVVADLHTGETRRLDFGVPVESARWSPGGAQFLVQDTAGHVRVHAHTNAGAANTTDAPLLDVPGSLAKWIDDERLLVARGSEAWVIHPVNGKLERVCEQGGAIRAIAVDVRIGTVFTGGADRDVRFSKLDDPRLSGSLVTAAQTDYERGSLMGCVGALAVAPSTGHLLVSMINATLTVVGYLPDRTSPARVDFAADRFGGRIAIDPLERWAVFSDFAFGRISWLNLRTLDFDQMVKGDVHTQAVTAVQFSRTGALCLTASLDGTVRIWDSATQRVKSTLRLPGTTIHDACFLPDEQSFLTADGRGQVKCWPVDPLPFARRFLAELKSRSR